MSDEKPARRTDRAVKLRFPIPLSNRIKEAADLYGTTPFQWVVDVILDRLNHLENYDTEFIDLRHEAMLKRKADEAKWFGSTDIQGENDGN